MSVLGTPSPAVTPTNLLYNVVATPGALYRYWRQGQTGGVLTRQLLLGTLPGVIAGSVIRVELLPGPQAADAIIAVVLIPLGTYLVVRKTATNPSGVAALVPLVPIAAIVGCVGGIYGIGGGSILAPILIGAGHSPTDVAPATLASTLATSIAGVATFLVLAGLHGGSVAPDWGIGVALGGGGLVGGYCGARIQPRLPEKTIRRLLGPSSWPSAYGTPTSPSGADNQRLSHRAHANWSQPAWRPTIRSAKVQNRSSASAANRDLSSAGHGPDDEERLGPACHCVGQRLVW